MFPLRGGLGPLTLASKAAVFSPSDLANLALWLKADALALNDGDAVSSWTDSSGNGRNATQAGAATLKPTYKTNILNGKPILRFDGGDFLSIGTAADWKFAHDGTTVTTWFAVAKFGTVTDPETAYVLFGTTITTAIPSGFYFVHDTRSAASRDRVMANLIGGAAINTSIRALNTQSAGATPANQFNIVSVKMDPGNATLSLRSSMRTNGGVAAENNTTTEELYTGNPRHALQIGTAQNSGGINTFFLAGDIAEIIMYSAALSDANRGSVQTYLATKYGITLA